MRSAPFSSFRSHQDGIALFEFVLVLPLLLLLLFGGIEMSRLILAHQQVDKTGNQMADLVTRSAAISRSDLDDITSVLPQLIDNYEQGRGQVIFTIVECQNPAGCSAGVNPVIVDQYATGGSLGSASQLGGIGARPNLSALELQSGQRAVSAEVYLLYDASFADLLASFGFAFLNSNELLYKRAIMKPRQGGLAQFT